MKNELEKVVGAKIELGYQAKGLDRVGNVVVVEERNYWEFKERIGELSICCFLLCADKRGWSQPDVWNLREHWGKCNWNGK